MSQLSPPVTHTWPGRATGMAHQNHTDRVLLIAVQGRRRSADHGSPFNALNRWPRVSTARSRLAYQGFRDGRTVASRDANVARAGHPCAIWRTSGWYDPTPGCPYGPPSDARGYAAERCHDESLRIRDSSARRLAHMPHPRSHVAARLRRDLATQAGRNTPTTTPVTRWRCTRRN